MNTERLVSAGIAVVVVTAIGLSASTFAASMSTDPEDAVSVREDLLPIGEDRQGDVQQVAQGVHDRYVEGSPEAGDAAAGADSGPEDAPSDGAGDDVRDKGSSDGDSATAPEAGDGAGSDDIARPEPVGDGGRDSGGAESAGQSDDAGSGQSQSGGDRQQASDSGGIDSEPPYLLALLAALLLVVVAVAYRYRRRIRDLFGGGDRPGEDGAVEMEPAPDNDVEQAWVELVRRAGVSAPRARTPGDCAQRAIETGYDPAAVNRLRRLFEDVQYGGTPPTEEQARLARETLARLDGETT